MIANAEWLWRAHRACHRSYFPLGAVTLDREHGPLVLFSHLDRGPCVPECSKCTSSGLCRQTMIFVPVRDLARSLHRPEDAERAEAIDPAAVVVHEDRLEAPWHKVSVLAVRSTSVWLQVLPAATLAVVHPRNGVGLWEVEDRPLALFVGVNSFGNTSLGLGRVGKTGNRPVLLPSHYFANMVFDPACEPERRTGLNNRAGTVAAWDCALIPTRIGGKNVSGDLRIETESKTLCNTCRSLRLSDLKRLLPTIDNRHLWQSIRSDIIAGLDLATLRVL